MDFERINIFLEMFFGRTVLCPFYRKNMTNYPADDLSNLKSSFIIFESKCFDDADIASIRNGY